MPLYTVVLEFDGGTYTQQFRAASSFSAAVKHAVRLVKNNDIGTVATRKRLAHKLATDKPTAIQGMRNVWWSEVSFSKHHRHCKLKSRLRVKDRENDR